MGSGIQDVSFWRCPVSNFGDSDREPFRGLSGQRELGKLPATVHSQPEPIGELAVLHESDGVTKE